MNEYGPIRYASDGTLLDYLYACPSCGAVVTLASTDKHTAWHDNLRNIVTTLLKETGLPLSDA